MPLPQLKKEISDKAGVDFHIYTADRFLELYKTDKKEIDDRTIEEVRKIRKSEEERMMIIRKMETVERKRELDLKLERYLMEYMHQLKILEGLMMEINESEIYPRYKKEVNHLFHRIRELKNRIKQGEISRMSLNRYTEEILFILDEIVHSEKIHPELSLRFIECIDRLEYLNQRFRIYM